jgi:hypothetical protein
MIKQLMEVGNDSVRTPEVRVSFEDDYLGEGITGLRGVLLSMSIYNGKETNIDMNMNMDTELAARLKTVVSLRIVLTSLELGPEKLEELTKKTMERLHRALEF